MNMILLRQEELADDGSALLTGRRHLHMVNTLGKRVGDRCKVGVRGGCIGTGVVAEQSANSTHLELEKLNAPPPEPLPVKLVMALPRPKTLRKVLRHAGALGVKEFHFFGAYKVERSYWSSPFLEPEFLEAEETLALEQSVDTAPWRVSFHRFFRPFVEDELPQLAANTRFTVCHPAGESGLAPHRAGEFHTLCLGPEGGFTDFEIKMLQAADARIVTLGKRILRTETALPFLLGKLFA